MAPLQKRQLDITPRDPWIMAISNELSSEIAAAILAKKGSPEDLSKLKEVLLEIHSTLQRMSEDEHPSRLRIASMKATGDNRSH